MNNHLAIAASVGIPAAFALANGVPVASVLSGTVAAVAISVLSTAGDVTAGVVATAGGGAAAIAVAVGGGVDADVSVVAGVVAIAAGAADIAARKKAWLHGKSNDDIQKAGWRAAIGTAAGAFAAACMTAGAIHVYGTNMPERAPADAAPKSTCDIKESSGKNSIGHNMGKIAVGRAASGAYTLTLPPAAATPPLALAA